MEAAAEAVPPTAHGRPTRSSSLDVGRLLASQVACWNSSAASVVGLLLWVRHKRTIPGPCRQRARPSRTALVVFDLLSQIPWWLGTARAHRAYGSRPTLLHQRHPANCLAHADTHGAAVLYQVPCRCYRGCCPQPQRCPVRRRSCALRRSLGQAQNGRHSRGCDSAGIGFGGNPSQQCGRCISESLLPRRCFYQGARRWRHGSCV